jgi:hypothetical protein
VAGNHQPLALIDELHIQAAAGAVVTDGDDQTVIINRSKRAQRAKNRPVEQMLVLALRRIVNVAGNVNMIARGAHREENIGHNLRVTAGADNHNTHNITDFL